MCGEEEGANLQIGAGVADDDGDNPRGHKAVRAVGTIFIKRWTRRYEVRVSESAESTDLDVGRC
jgi:hypothetical protein